MPDAVSASPIASLITASTFSVLFLIALGTSLLLRVILTLRQMRQVAGHRHQVPPAFAQKISLEAHQKAADYTLAKNRLGLLELATETLLLLALTYGGLLNGLHGFWAPFLGGNGEAGELSPAYGIALIFSVALLSSLVDLPFAWYRQFHLEARFGFNRMTPTLFWVDHLKMLALGGVLGGAVLWIVLTLLAALGSLGWLWVWLFWCGFSLVMLFIVPVWIMPLFNRFTPLPEGPLRTRIETLLERCGFQSSGLFVMDGSRRSAHGNAYFTGFGRNKRIVFFDTLIEGLTPGEMEAILAHELGHFRHHHVLKRIALSFVTGFLFCAALGHLLHAPWFFSGLGVTGQSHALALILFFLALPPFLFLATPLSSMLSRKHEYEADAYAAAHARPEDLIAALVRLYSDNASTLTPDPLHSLFYDSHPPASLRIAHLEQLAHG